MHSTGWLEACAHHWPDRPPARLGPHAVHRSTAVTLWSRWPPVGSSVCASHSNSDALEQHDTGCVRHLFRIRFIPLYLFCNILYTYIAPPPNLHKSFWCCCRTRRTGWSHASLQTMAHGQWTGCRQWRHPTALWPWRAVQELPAKKGQRQRPAAERCSQRKQ